MVRFCALIIVCISAMAARPVYAQAPLSCGPSPEMPAQSAAYEKIKGDLEAKANALIKLLGNPDLKAAVDDERRAINKSASGLDAAWQIAHLSYVFCSKVMADTSKVIALKLNAIVQFRRGACTIPQDVLVAVNEFVAEGAKMQDNFVLHEDPVALKKSFDGWEPRARKFLLENSGMNYAMRFSGRSETIPMGRGYWQEIGRQIGVLLSVSNELRACSAT